MYDTAAIAMLRVHRIGSTQQPASHWDWPTISVMHQPATSAMVLDDATACFFGHMQRRLHRSCTSGPKQCCEGAACRRTHIDLNVTCAPVG
ncbi:hypothetical protein [Xanthomonas campestris]|uniref:hypothetical protein n=1 Tax=Xanthomonas campestris TaxID=339 RepID=UPI00138FA5B7|nr:hypothetical protein [Xanthomonas campestris]MCF8828504.1 hypothetical protein [Xanthomonas campestris pv. raphani]MCW1983222.1 hypothetical protein [Xanthomonas campestris]MCW2008577.1 hypothetical protein [Xanthomonas campestris]MEA9840229.1 hypothetical protein [Xanthomonas campestris pv. raphani]MEA9877561.1 hypothetical protein [Xanthomonas campestris pv. raphani]